MTTVPEQMMTWKGHLADRVLSLVPASFARRLMTVFARRYLRTRADSFEPSMILSVADDVPCSDRLLAIAIDAIGYAAKHDLSELARAHAGKPGAQFYDRFPVNTTACSMRSRPRCVRPRSSRSAPTPE